MIDLDPVPFVCGCIAHGTRITRYCADHMRTDWVQLLPHELPAAPLQERRQVELPWGGSPAVDIVVRDHGGNTWTITNVWVRALRAGHNYNTAGTMCGGSAFELSYDSVMSRKE